MLIDGYCLASNVVSEMFAEKPRCIEVDLAPDDLLEFVRVPEERESRCSARQKLDQHSEQLPLTLTLSNALPVRAVARKK